MSDTAPSPAITDLDLLCPSCGYNLRGSASDRCPECGLAIDRAALSASIIPWLNRGAIGRWRAYWRTCWLVLRRPTLVGREVSKPVLFSDTASFRRASVLLLAGLMGIVALVGYAVAADDVVGFLDYWGGDGLRLTTAPDLGRAMDLLLPTAAGWLVWPLVPLYVWLFVQAITGVASHWFHPKSISVAQQNRAVALGNLTLAPLLLLPLAGGLLLVAIAVTRMARDAVGFEWRALAQFVGVLPVLVAIAGIGGFWIGTLKIMRAATTGTAGRQLAMAVALPFTWLIVGLLTLVALPWTIGYTALVFSSLR